MKIITSSIITFLFIILLSSCEKKEKVSEWDIYHTWEATDFFSLESVLYAKIDNYNPAIAFNRDGSFSLKLDRNICSGNFNLPGNSGIDITAPGCTKMCCDSDFSNKFAGLLSRVESYSIEEDKMNLEIPDWGFISLKLKQND